jgi:hypothetical protein
MTAAIDRLAARAAALVFALVFTSTALAAIDALAHQDRAAEFAQKASSVERG